MLLPGPHVKEGDSCVVCPSEGDRTVKAQAVLAGLHHEAVARSAHPGRDRAVVEPHDQLHVHLD